MRRGLRLADQNDQAFLEAMRQSGRCVLVMGLEMAWLILRVVWYML